MNENSYTVVERVTASDRLAFKQRDAAQLIGISYESLRREVRRRKLFVTPTLKVLPKEEILRYLRDEIQLACRKRGPYRGKAAAVAVPITFTKE